jgi:predicted DNA-binding transcriptional regulator AlpA
MENYLRLSQIVGDPKATPPIPAIIPVAKSTFWGWVKKGLVQQPHKIGQRVSVWPESYIRSLPATLTKQ